MPSPRARRLTLWIGIPVLVIAVAIALFRWDWLIPLIEPRASAALGRPVTITHLHVRLARSPVITVEGVTVAAPKDFPDQTPFATVDRLSAEINAWDWWWNKARMTIPWIEVDRPVVTVLATDDGKRNYDFALGAPAGESQPAEADTSPLIGQLRLRDGSGKVLVPQMKADFAFKLATEEPQGEPARLVASAEGRYANQPIKGNLVGGAVLSLRDEQNPWPIELNVQNGPTQAQIKGTLRNPLALAGANLRLSLRGPDMALLAPLTGVPIPKTPTYRLASQIDYADGRVRLREIDGVVGRSDIRGSLDIRPAEPKPEITVDMTSRSIDLDDFAGFIGGDPGPAKPKPASASLLPDDPISMPKLTAADFHVKYKAGSIRGGRAMPLDNLVANFDIVNGAINLHPISFAVGKGELRFEGELAPAANDALRADITADFRRMDIATLMAAAGSRGGGSLSGKATLKSTGRSVKELLGNGDGRVTMHTAGGDLSAFLVDLSGLRLANAVLSALGLPDRSELKCFIGDFALKSGVLNTQAMIIDTSTAVITGEGQVDLKREMLNYRLRTAARDFTIGALSTDIRINGPMRSPSVGPEPVELGARGAAAVGLAFLNPLLAILPTIQFGSDEESGCGGLASRAKQQGR